MRGLAYCDKTKAARAAMAAELDVIEYRKGLFNEEVERVMKRRWFPIKDRSKAEKYVNDHTTWTDAWFAGAWGQLDKAEDIFALCQASDEPHILVNEDLAELINKFKEKGE